MREVELMSYWLESEAFAMKFREEVFILVNVYLKLRRSLYSNARYEIK